MAATAHAQPLNIAGRDLTGKEMVFVAEIHSIEDKWQFYAPLVAHLATHNGLRNIVLEMGHSRAWLLNKYLHERDTTFSHYFPADTAVLRFIDHVRIINDSLPAAHKLSIKGIDFERMEFAIVTQRIFSKHPSISNSPLNQYVSAIPAGYLTRVRKTMEQTALRAEVYTKACTLFAAEKAILKTALQDDYNILELMFENPSQETAFGLRDQGMYRNMILQQLTTLPFLCITGSYHTALHTISFHSSFVKLLLRHTKTRKDKVAIINEVRNGPYIEQRLMVSDTAAQVKAYGKAGPRPFIKSRRAMTLGYTRYFRPGHYTLAHQHLFRGRAERGNHRHDSWYVFFGVPPGKSR